MEGPIAPSEARRQSAEGEGSKECVSFLVFGAVCYAPEVFEISHANLYVLVPFCTFFVGERKDILAAVFYGTIAALFSPRDRHL